MDGTPQNATPIQPLTETTETEPAPHTTTSSHLPADVPTVAIPTPMIVAPKSPTERQDDLQAAQLPPQSENLDAGPGTNHQLNVTDALRFLDAVKAEFHDRPDVYNAFLDVMKDFKSQVIDTPRVIERVVNLFHGHPSLFQGFNTFLPIGYRIEVGSDAQSSAAITVKTPSGIMVPSTNSPSIPLPPSQLALPIQEPSQPPPPLLSTSIPGFSNTPKPSADFIDVVDEHERQWLGPAMDYVQRIKTRFADDPDKYKQFLEIMASHESSADDAEVFAKVEELFKDAPDLSAAFSNFLHAERSMKASDRDWKKGRDAGCTSGSHHPAGREPGSSHFSAIPTPPSPLGCDQATGGHARLLDSASEDTSSSGSATLPAHKEIYIPPDYDEENAAHVAVGGRLPKEINTNTLPRWRSALRRKYLAVVERESEIIGRWQTRVQSRWLDAYFLYTSILGTHTFFLMVLPAFFFFGNDELGRGLCYALAFGVYLSSLLKALVCSPRPYAFCNHHLDHIYDVHRAGSLSTTALASWFAVLVLYVSSIVGGQLYAGMHGFLDVSVGTTLGVIAWALQRLVMPEVERWITSSGWSAPLIVTLVCLLLVNQHPSLIDDCPCFGDAISFVSMILGIVTSFWLSKRVPVLNADLFTSITPGATFDSPSGITTWVLFALLKLTTGTLVVLSWAMLAKSIAQKLLSPFFHWLARTSPVRLPLCCHYTRGPSHALRAVPGMIDLDLEVKRGDWSVDYTQEKVIPSGAGEGGVLEDDEVNHCDTDVLTKVLVYAGMGAIGTVIVPAMFEALEWGVGSH